MNLSLTEEELNELKCILSEYQGVNNIQLDCINIQKILDKIKSLQEQKGCISISPL